MKSKSVYIAGWFTLLPFFLAQVYLGQISIRRWPRARAAVYFVWALLAVGLIAGRPMWLKFAAYSWLYPSAASAILIYLLGRFRTPKPTDASRRDLLLGAAASAPFACAIYATFIERTAFQVQEVRIPVPNLDPTLENLRILQISDVHLSAFLSEAQFARIVDAARELKPTLALYTGDFISSRGDPLEACIRQLARISAPEGAYGCLGNHEIYAEVEVEATALARRYGIDILRSQNRLLTIGGGRLNLAGVDYQSFARRSHYLDGASSLLVPGTCNMLLSHNPDVFPTAARLGFDLTLAGHTHGGQVNIEILNRNYNPAQFYTPFVKGLYATENRSCYVSSGIGCIMFPARFGVPPEISLLHLVRG